jgi:hypothetical protein
MVGNDNDNLSMDFLRTELGILLADEEAKFQDTTLEFQTKLEKRFGARYDLDRINDELEVLWIENEVEKQMEEYKGGMSKYLYTCMIPEDY